MESRFPAATTVTQTPTRGFEELVAPYAGAYARLEAFLHEQVGEFEPEVQPLVRYTFSHSGKKLRPLLVFMSGWKSEAENEVPEELVRVAAIVELVHLATLVHDDILDSADTRHRTATVVAHYGAHAAVLLGDALFAHALYLAAQFPTVDVCRAVALATRQVCSGEIAQTFARGGELLDRDTYYRFIRLKTAELFSASAFLGAFISGQAVSSAEAVRSFADHLGIAYQIYDDAADLFSQEERAGKTLGTDLATGKLTLPTLIWLEQMEPIDREQQLAALFSGELSADQLRNSLNAAGVLDDVAACFSAQIAAARSALNGFYPPARRVALGRLADFLQASWNKFSIK